jgi:hypothetical protein
MRPYGSCAGPRAGSRSKRSQTCPNPARTKPAWRRLEPLLAPGRMLAAVGAHGDSFYVFGGAALEAGPDGKPVREWLRDADRYTPGKGWNRIADLPRPAVAAPSPAPGLNGRLRSTRASRMRCWRTTLRLIGGNLLARHRSRSSQRSRWFGTNRL